MEVTIGDCPSYADSLLKGGWWLIPLTKWVITLALSRISRVNPCITMVV